MTYQWKRSRGMVNVCPKCNGNFGDEEYDFEEDTCLKCLFPQTGVTMPVMYEYSHGVPKNTTAHAELLDDLEYRPTTQSNSAIKAKRDYEWRNYGKYKGKNGKIKSKKDSFIK